MEGLACDRVGGVVLIPPGDQFIAGLADVLTVDDCAGEDSGDVQAVAESSIGAILNVERAIQGNIGRVRAKPFHFDAAA